MRRSGLRGPLWLATLEMRETETELEKVETLCCSVATSLRTRLHDATPPGSAATIASSVRVSASPKPSSCTDTLGHASCSTRSASASAPGSTRASTGSLGLPSVMNSTCMEWQAGCMGSQTDCLGGGWGA